jgi:hypothetical protein
MVASPPQESQSSISLPESFHKKHLITAQWVFLEVRQLQNKHHPDEKQFTWPVLISSGANVQPSHQHLQSNVNTIKKINTLFSSFFFSNQQLPQTHDTSAETPVVAVTSTSRNVNSNWPVPPP